jgi:hypothetical protein
MVTYVKLRNGKVVSKKQLENNIRQAGVQGQPIEYEEVSDIEVLQTLLDFGGYDK